MQADEILRKGNTHKNQEQRDGQGDSRRVRAGHSTARRASERISGKVSSAARTSIGCGRTVCKGGHVRRVSILYQEMRKSGGTPQLPVKAPVISKKRGARRKAPQQNRSRFGYGLFSYSTLIVKHELEHLLGRRRCPHRRERKPMQRG